MSVLSTKRRRVQQYQSSAWKLVS